MRLSPTFVITVEQCTLRARWLRIDKAHKDTPDADEGLRSGRAVHQALEKIYTDVVNERHVGPLHSPAWLGRARHHIDQAVADNGPFNDQRISDMRMQVLDYLLDQHQVAGGDILGVEQFLQMGLRPGTNVVGFVDRIDRRDSATLGVVDYKGGWRRWHPDIVRSELQTQTYALVAFKRHPWARKVLVEIAMLGHRETASAVWTDQDMPTLEAQLRERYLAADDLMKDGPWEARRGDHCDRCEFKPWCPEWGGTPQPGTWNPELEALQPEGEDDG